MRFSITLINVFLCAFVHAQSPVDILPGSMMTCQNGYTPSLTCGNPVPADELCSCTCRDGATFNQTRPSPSEIVAPVPTSEPPVRQFLEKPCLAEAIRPWQDIYLNHTEGSYAPSEKLSDDIDVPEDSILMVADSKGRCQHFEVHIDGQLIGVTSGTGILNNDKCGPPEKCVKEFGGSVGYFSLPKGNHNIGLRWVGITDACKHISTAAGSYRIYKPC